MKILLLYFVLSFVSSETENDVKVSRFDTKTMEELYEKGKIAVDRLFSRANIPRYGICWTDSLKNLQMSCHKMDEDIQFRLAISFTSCFNEMMGLPPFLCGPLDKPKECIKALDDSALNTFRDYFLHTQDMCFYLQHQLWQEETDKAVNELTMAAEGVTKKIQDTKTTQDQILESQKESLKVQSTLRQDNNALYSAVVRVKEIFDDFKNSANEHRIAFVDIFDKITKMQELVSWIGCELSLIDKIAFYSVYLFIGFFATSTPRTKGARFGLVMLLLVSLTIEKYFSTYEYDVAFEEIQEQNWNIRKGLVFLATFILLIAAALFRDYNIMNNTMLIKMDQRVDRVASRVDTILKFMEELSGSRAMTNSLGNLVEVVRAKDDREDLSSIDSFSTYSESNSDQDLSYDSDDGIEEIPFDDEIFSPNTNQENIGQLNQGNVSERQKNGTFNNSLTGFFPTSPDKSTPTHGYNLRKRTPAPENPIIHTESVTEFAHLIKKPPLKKNINFNEYSSGDE